MRKNKTYLDELMDDKKFREKFGQEYNESHPRRLAIKKLIQKLLSVFEQENAVKWLNTSNQSLEGRTPLKEIMYNDEGIEKIVNLLGAIKCGIIT